jgi:hypothetical protein
VDPTIIGRAPAWLVAVFLSFGLVVCLASHAVTGLVPSERFVRGCLVAALVMGVVIGVRAAPAGFKALLSVGFALAYSMLGSYTLPRCEPCLVNIRCPPCVAWGNLVSWMFGVAAASAGVVNGLRAASARRPE